MKECKHENLYENYLDTWPCPTPYCIAREVHCKDCGRFVTTCECGYNNGESGWPDKRYRKITKRRNKNAKSLV